MPSLADRDPSGEIRAWIGQTRGSPLRGLTALPGGAGRRRYWRAELADGDRCILMHACPEDPAILPPALRAPRVEIPFVHVTELLARHGIPVPEIYAVMVDERYVLLEDLGDRHLVDLPVDERAARQRDAIDLLVRLHAIPPEAECLPFERRFDAEWIDFELGLFLEQVPASSPREALERELSALARAIAELPTCLCHRDYQSHNLLIDPAGALRVIDYQDALLAPAELDLCALLFDSYIEIADAERSALLERYGAARGRAVEPGPLAMLVVQRKCKDLSRYRRVVSMKRDMRFAPARDAARGAISRALPSLPRAHTGLAELLPAALEAPA